MKGLHDTISVHVLQGENTEAIQQESNSASKIHIVVISSAMLLHQIVYHIFWAFVYMTIFTARH